MRENEWGRARMEVGRAVKRLLKPPAERGWWCGREAPVGVERNAQIGAKI